MAQIKSITEQELAGTKIRLVWACKEKTRLQIILWCYKKIGGSNLCAACESYIKTVNRMRLQTYFHENDAENFYREFLDVYSAYENTKPDMTWYQYLDYIEENH